MDQLNLGKKDVLAKLWAYKSKKILSDEYLRETLWWGGWKTKPRVKVAYEKNVSKHTKRAVENSEFSDLDLAEWITIEIIFKDENRPNLTWKLARSAWTNWVNILWVWKITFKEIQDIEILNDWSEPELDEY